jgi:hypothetical protein
MRRVRLRRYLAITKGGEVAVLEATIPEWEKKTQRLQELNDWCHRAAKELRNIPDGDDRWKVYNKYKLEAETIEKEIEQIEQTQEAALTNLVKESGPIVLEMEDGALRTLAASPGSRGDGETLLPRDFLNVWRVCKVFEGSVVMGGVPAKLSFGDAAQVATVRVMARRKPAKKGAVVSEDGSLFGKD